MIKLRNAVIDLDSEMQPHIEVQDSTKTENPEVVKDDPVVE